METIFDEIARGNIDTVRNLIQEGVDINVQTLYGDTLLHIASLNGHLDIVKMLIEEGADLDVEGECGRTPLHNASSKGSLKLVELLLRMGANPDVQDISGDTPLASALLRRGNTDIVKLLLRKGANPHTQNKMGITPLHMAVLNKHLDVVELLIKKGVDINAQDIDGLTPLHHLSINGGSLELLDFLIKKGADPTIQDIDGFTPLDAALYEGYKEIAEYLEHNKANVNTHRKVSMDPQKSPEWDNSPRSSVEDNEDKLKYTQKALKFYMEKYNLIQKGWKYGIMNSLIKAGFTLYYNKELPPTFYNSNRILISLSYIESSRVSKRDIRDIILHEIAHAIVGFDADHGPIWKEKAISIGCSGNKNCKFFEDNNDYYEYYFSCPGGCVYRFNNIDLNNESDQSDQDLIKEFKKLVKSIKTGEEIRCHRHNLPFERIRTGFNELKSSGLINY